MDSSALLQLKLPLEYNDILRTVNEQKGFENFLLGDESSSSRLLAKLHASPGPIVDLNLTGALITTTLEGVISIPLPEFTYDRCIEHEALVLDSRRVMATEPDRASTQMNTVLTWLWVAVAEPVLEKLDITGSLDAHQRLPRIWWLSNKWTSLFPIHAAGDHPSARRTGEACTVMDRAISSYVPSIRALDFLRRSAANLSSTKNREAILVKMPTTPDDTDLPNVENEVARVEGWLKPSFQVVSLTRPRREDVLSLLETASVAHFACHGVANADDPFLSTLELQDWKNHPLDVRALLGVSCKHLEFVYLSFCEITTTTTPAAASRMFQDECIHLPGAFQMTGGVPYMVASIWKVEDHTISAEVSGDVYAFLKEGEFDFGRSAEALHAASLKARNKGADALYWAAFVHFGV